MGPKDAQTRTCLDFLVTPASADRNGAVIDMAGYESAKFIVKFSAIAAGAVTSVKLQQGAVANMSDAADLEGTGVTVAADDDDQVFAIAIEKPRERYLRLVIDKDATNVTDECAIVELYGARTLPALANVTDELTFEYHVSPAEGTA